MNTAMFDPVITTFSVLVIMALLSCLYCLHIRNSDLKMQRCLLELAQEKGVEIDLRQLDPKYATRAQFSNDGCAIMVPDFTIII